MASTIRVKAVASGGKTVVQSLIRHPMDSGFVKDRSGKLIPPHHIEVLEFVPIEQVDPLLTLDGLRLLWGRREFEHQETVCNFDPWRNGLEPNRKNIQRFALYSYEQGLSRRHWQPEDLFVPISDDH